MKTDYSDQFNVDDENIIRWKSNNAVPPEGCLDEMYADGFIDKDQYDNSVIMREKETMITINKYKERMKNHVYSDEEKFEMRSVFGEGAIVINVITGEAVQF